MASHRYQICNNCVMDTSDPSITFDNSGVCSYCRTFELKKDISWKPNQEGAEWLEQYFRGVKRERANKRYDVILGMSGGIDSSYLAYKLKKFDLRVLAVHVDCGWNSELAVSNIEMLVKKLKFDLKTVVIDWREMRDLQLSYFRSGVANQDVPQDHAIFANLLKVASKEKIRHIVSGSNFATESVLPEAWQHDAMDSINLKDIHKRYGKIRLETYSTVSWFDYWIKMPYWDRITTVCPLNYLHYRKQDAVAELEEIGFKTYTFKHGESRFTTFFQSYYLPKKFGFDKRKPHYSSLILSGQMSRQLALEDLKTPPYDQERIHLDIEYLCKKLKINESEFHMLMEIENSYYSQFANWDKRNYCMNFILKYLSRIKKRLFK